MIWICGTYTKSSYLAWNKKNNLKKSSKVKEGTGKKIVTKKEKIISKNRSMKTKKKTKNNPHKNKYKKLSMEDNHFGITLNKFGHFILLF